jgi:flavin reductase (DIM6/NTAB) family NADH-FMN oxidoreductase RutF
MTTKADGQVDTMTIGWGTMGIQWGKPIFIAYVRESRYTKALVDKNPEFTINVPVEVPAKEILGVCGRESGRDVDKIEKLGLRTVDGDTVAVPAIVELPLTLECKVIYRQDQDLSLLREDCRNRYYKPGTVDEDNFHTAYYGEITAAYIVKD